MTELRITATESGQKPKYRKAAAALLELCREFYQDQENERAYQEWKEKKNDTSQLIQRDRGTRSGSGNGGVYNRRAV